MKLRETDKKTQYAAQLDHVAKTKEANIQIASCSAKKSVTQPDSIKERKTSVLREPPMKALEKWPHSVKRRPVVFTEERRVSLVEVCRHRSESGSWTIHERQLDHSPHDHF